MANTQITIGSGSYSRSRGSGSSGDPYVQQPELTPGQVQRVTPTITASAYAAGYSVGGVQTLSSVNSASGRPVLLVNVSVADKAGHTPALTIKFFRAAPSGGTYSNHGAVVWGSGDSANEVGQIQILPGDYVTVAGVSTVHVSAGLLLDVASTDLSVLVLAGGAFTPSSTSDFSFTFGFEQK